MKKNKLTKHHIIPRSRFNEVKTSLKVGDAENIKYLKQSIHDALHRLFGNKTPKEQFEMLLEINEKVLNPMIREMFEILISYPDERFYKNNN